MSITRRKARNIRKGILEARNPLPNFEGTEQLPTVVRRQMDIIQSMKTEPYSLSTLRHQSREVIRRYGAPSADDITTYEFYAYTRLWHWTLNNRSKNTGKVTQERIRRDLALLTIIEAETRKRCAELDIKGWRDI